jgi:DNA-binding Lrp family transcriptional regulator
VSQVLDAYILIQGELSKTAIVAALVQAVPGVSETEIVTGPYDVIARAQAPDMNKLAEQVTSQIQAIRGVTRTTTCTIVQPSRRRPISPGRTRWIRQARWAPDGSLAKPTQGLSTAP